ncbi:hypothetical protein [Myxococcus landrumensis]|uniref:Uncharacterized protein n=1 Tax=Myxococcus landrumensis TaxID=2813577 RepID=A0ABX7NEL1_9BACT|nr:hypothetical protein [Myxococcus landrumus]QSQ17225.1 hypothetical protein JY572_14690 [Myxococcus landrumus]
MTKPALQHLAHHLRGYTDFKCLAHDDGNELLLFGQGQRQGRTGRIPKLQAQHAMEDGGEAALLAVAREALGITEPMTGAEVRVLCANLAWTRAQAQAGLNESAALELRLLARELGAIQLCARGEASPADCPAPSTAPPPTEGESVLSVHIGEKHFAVTCPPTEALVKLGELVEAASSNERNAPSTATPANGAGVATPAEGAAPSPAFGVARTPDSPLCTCKSARPHSLDFVAHVDTTDAREELEQLDRRAAAVAERLRAAHSPVTISEMSGAINSASSFIGVITAAGSRVSTETIGRAVQSALALVERAEQLARGA